MSATTPFPFLNRPEVLPDLTAARAKRRELRQQRRARKLEHENQLMESCGIPGGSAQWVGDFYNMLDRWNQQFVGATNINDRRFGRNIPMWMNEIDLQVARMPSRILASTNDYAIGLLEGWTSFILGEGYVFTIQAKPGKEAQVPKCILAKLTAVDEDFALRNQWEGGEQPGLEEELVQRPEVEGEDVGVLYEDDAGLTWLNICEPEQLTAPPGAGIDYLFGVYIPQGGHRPEKYWLRGMNTDLHGEEYDAEQIVHFKQNVMRGMKRGFPTFSFSHLDTLKLSNELRESLGTGARDQAAVAILRQWETATGEDMKDFTSKFADYTKTLPGGQQVPVTVSRPGTTMDAPKGMTFADPPNAKNALAHIQILHACLRAATVRYNAPDFLGSGDASSNTYDNADATDGLFGRRIIREQQRYKHTFHRIRWWALDTRCTRAGVVTAVDNDGQVYSMPWDQLRNLVELKVTPPPPKERDKDKEADRLTKLVQAKLMSPQQAIVELGEDVDETMEQIKTWQEEMPPPAAPGADGAAPAGGGALAGVPKQDLSRDPKRSQGAKNGWLKRRQGKLSESAEWTEIPADVLELLEKS